MALRRIARRDESFREELKRSFPKIMEIEGEGGAASLAVMNAIRAYEGKGKAQ
jgi:hypothetical protein